MVQNNAGTNLTLVSQLLGGSPKHLGLSPRSTRPHIRIQYPKSNQAGGIIFLLDFRPSSILILNRAKTICSDTALIITLLTIAIYTIAQLLAYGVCKQTLYVPMLHWSGVVCVSTPSQGTGGTCQPLV